MIINSALGRFNWPILITLVRADYKIGSKVGFLGVYNLIVVR
jgi:hypothetical protein